MPTRNARHAEQRPRGRDSLFERVDVDLSFEVVRKFGEVSVESVDVVVDSDEVIFGVVEFVEAGMADEVVEITWKHRCLRMKTLNCKTKTLIHLTKGYILY